MVLNSNVFPLALLLVIIANACSADTTAWDESKKGPLRGRSSKQQDEEGINTSTEKVGIKVADTSAGLLAEEPRHLNRLFGSAQGGGSSSQETSPAEAGILLAANPLSHSSSINKALIGESDPTIVGGTNAGSTEFPFFVQGDGCGASLIWYDIALSAAHCIGDPFKYGVLIGNYRKNSMDGNPQIRLVSKQVPHPSYSSTTDNYDFLVLKLNAPVNRTGRSQPIPLNNVTANPANGANLTIIGFGDTTDGGTSSTNLLKATVKAVSQTSCNSATSYNGKITTAMLCASAPGKDSCQGDSGGPIFNAARVQVGVTSWGNGCAQTNYPGVYARVSSAYSWIRGQVCSLSQNPPSYCSGSTTGGGGGTSTLRNVTIIIQEDDYPEETSWTLKNSAGQVLGSQAVDSVTTPKKLVERKFFLSAGTYTLTISDDQSDGFCCGYGMGFFLIMVNGNVVKQNLGKFAANLQTTFTI